MKMAWVIVVAGVALLRIVIDLDPPRAVPLVASHVDDTTPAMVNTCLVLVADRPH